MPIPGGAGNDDGHHQLACTKRGVAIRVACNRCRVCNHCTKLHAGRYRHAEHTQRGDAEDADEVRRADTEIHLMFFRIFGTVMFALFVPVMWIFVFTLIPSQIVHGGFVAIATAISTFAVWRFSGRKRNEW